MILSKMWLIFGFSNQLPAVILLGCVWEWWRILSGAKKAEIHEAPYVALDAARP